MGLDFAQAAEIERLERLRYDLDSALGRLLTECVRASTHVAPDLSGEWMQRAALVEELREWALRDVDRWVTNAAHST